MWWQLGATLGFVRGLWNCGEKRWYLVRYMMIHVDAILLNQTILQVVQRLATANYRGKVGSCWMCCWWFCGFVSLHYSASIPCWTRTEKKGKSTLHISSAHTWPPKTGGHDPSATHFYDLLGDFHGDGSKPTETMEPDLAEDYHPWTSYELWLRVPIVPRSWPITGPQPSPNRSMSTGWTRMSRFGMMFHDLPTRKQDQSK